MSQQGANIPANQFHVGQLVDQQTGESIVNSEWSPVYGWLNLTNKGGVYTGGGGTQGINSSLWGGSYLGYLNDLQTVNPQQYAIESQNPEQFSNGKIVVNPDGSYSLVDNAGQSYAFPNLPQPSASDNGVPTADTSAWDQIQQTLSGYGFTPDELSQLLAFAKNEIINGNSPTQIALDIQNQPAFQQRFPAIAQRQQNGLPPISVSDYLSLEDSYAQAEQAAGIPPNWASYDQLIANNVSPTEYSDRLTEGYEAVAKADPTVIQAFQDYYGAGPSQLAAYFLNPQKALPQLIQQATAAQIGGAASQSHYNTDQRYGPLVGSEGLSQDEALRLAQLGVTQAQAQSGFSQIAKESQVTGTLPGQGQHALTQDQLLNATFGSDGLSAQQIAENEQLQKNYFAQGTQVGASSTGLQGAGVVQR